MTIESMCTTLKERMGTMHSNNLAFEHAPQQSISHWKMGSALFVASGFMHRGFLHICNIVQWATNKA